MSEVLKYCKNCKHYDTQYCNYKKIFKSTYDVCEHWKEKIFSIDEVFEGAKKEIEQIDDPVSHPSHYTDGNIEVIDYIEDKKLNFNLGNVIKYISRAGKKDTSKTLQDLKKAQWYLNREISNLEKNA